MHILVAADADYVISEVVAALSGPDTSFTVCRNGRDVTAVVARRAPDLAVLDLQIGSKGGMAVTMDLRLDESGGRLPHVKVLMLLDRRADVHLAKRCGAEAWLVKPVDPLTLRFTARDVMAGTLDMTDPDGTAPADDADDAVDDGADLDAAGGVAASPSGGGRRWKRRGAAEAEVVAVGAGSPASAEEPAQPSG